MREIEISMDRTMRSKQATSREHALAHLIAYQRDLGVKDRFSPQAINRFTCKEEAKALASFKQEDVGQDEQNKEPSKKNADAKIITSTQNHVSEAERLAAQATTLDELRSVVEDYEGCALKEAALNTVFADGDQGAKVMIIGEAPGSDEDRQGKPFVGVSGQLLDTMLSHIGLDRKSGFYITNTVFWRPPGNRKPNPSEVGTCLPFTKRHIELKAPKILVLVGGLATQSLLDPTLKITRARGKWFQYPLQNGASLPALPILHPAYLLRTPLSKRETWADLLRLKEKLAAL